MSSRTSTKQQAPAVTHIQTMRGHTNEVRGVVHLPGERRIITCSSDGSLRLWDLVSGAQIGGDWRDHGARESAAYKIALSPNGKIVSSGSQDGKVRLWDVKTGRVIRRWTGHTGYVSSVCWSANGKRIMSGSWDGMVRVWNVKRGERILEIKTGHEDVWAAIYSPDNKQIATGGFSKNTVKIWDAKMGELITTLKHDYIVCSLAWTSDGKQLISASYGLIRIFDTATWRLAAILGGHRSYVNAITLSRDNRLLASTSDDNTARLWNLETNLPVGPPIRHEHVVECAALSADGKLLVTGCSNNTTYTWDIHAFLKHAGLEDLLPTGTNIDSLEHKASQGEPETQRAPHSSLSDKSFSEADATEYHDVFGGVNELSLQFFETNDSSPTGGAHPHSSAILLITRLASLLHRFRPDHANANELSQPSALSGSHPRTLVSRLSSLIYRSPRENYAPNELQQPSTPSRIDLRATLARPPSSLPRLQLNTEETEPHDTMPSSSRPDAIMDHLSSIFRSQPHTNEDIELSQRPMRPHVFDLAPIWDNNVLCVAEWPQPTRPSPRPPRSWPTRWLGHIGHFLSFASPLKPVRQRTQPNNTTTPGARPVYSRPVRLLGHIGLYLCCVWQHDVNAQPTQQQQGQSQGQVMRTYVTSRTQQKQQGHSQSQVQAQVTPSQKRPAAPSPSVTPTAPNYTLTPGVASA